MATFDSEISASDLTVADLKDILASAGVVAPKSGKRQVYVELYEELVAKKRSLEDLSSSPPALEEVPDESHATLQQDPHELTVNELKSLLSSLGVPLPVSAAKKQVYVDLFNDFKQNKFAKKLSSPTPSKSAPSSSPSTPLGKADPSEYPQKVSPIKRRATPVKRKTAEPDAAAAAASEPAKPKGTRTPRRSPASKSKTAAAAEPAAEPEAASSTPTPAVPLPEAEKQPEEAVEQEADKRPAKRSRLNSSHQIISYDVVCLKKKMAKRKSLDGSFWAS
eukprot:TRINITY_DN27874_c0_g1_i1.p1 TRINITY_DN27874_c0_g1~~TRINITY_DN27874_c0_g1_i1.p1  ORF type:complete len:278 (+),score=67.85 TRINITY_DN27874_c0_g1_i1:63-896(+)